MPYQENTSRYDDLKLTLVILACGTVNGINIAKLAPTIEVIRTSFSLSLSSLGILASLFSLLTVLSGVIIGAGVRAIGAKKSLIFALILALFGSLLTALFQTIEALFFGRIVEGIGLITVMLTAPALITQHTSPARRGLLMGIWSGFMPLGNAMVLLAAPLILLQYSWHAVWIISNILMLLTIIFSLAIIPRDRVQSSGGIDLNVIREAISTPILMILGLLFAMHSVMYQAMLQFMPSFSKALFSLTLFKASLITVAFCILSFSGNIIAGYFIQRGWAPARLVLIAGLSLSALILVMSISSTQPIIFAFALVFIGIISGTIPTVCFYLLSHVQTADPRDMPVYTAWLFQIQGFGMFLGPAIFASIVEGFNSWIFGIGVLSLVCLGKAALSFTLNGKS